MLKSLPLSFHKRGGSEPTLTIEAELRALLKQLVERGGIGRSDLLGKMPVQRLHHDVRIDSIRTSGARNRVAAWQRDNELGKCAGLGVDIDPAAMLLDDDVVRHGKAEPGS